MLSRALLAGVLAGLALFAPAASGADRDAGAPTPPHTPSFVPGHVIVQWAPDADRADRLDARADADVASGRRLGHRDFGLVEVERGQTVADAIDALEANPAVVSAERDGLDTLHAASNDTLFGDLWGLRNAGGALGVAGFANPLAGADIDALGAWVRTVGTPSTVVAVLDSGYRFSHPDLGPAAWTNSDEVAGNGIDDDANGYVDDRQGYDFVGPSSESPSSDSNPNDDNLLSGGHGVHTAGTIGARGNDGVGITGVAQNVRLMPLRVCAHSASAGDARCPVSSQIAAINYAGANGARVANVSLGGTTYTQATVNAIAANPGTLFVISAGNDAQDNESTHHYPCDYRPTVDAGGPVDNIVCVAATDQADGLASFSDYGAISVDLGAPGTETLSAHPTSGRFQETFSADDFASKWSATAANGFARASGAPLTSPGMTDTPNGAPAAGAIYESTLTTGFAVPAGPGSCTFRGRRLLVLGSGSFTYSILRDGTPVFTSSPASTAGSAMVSFNTVPIAGLGGGSVQVRFRYTADGSPSASEGAWLDDLGVTCFDSPTSTAATFQYLQGTSMAAPHVSGAAALLFSMDPGASVTDVRGALLGGVDPIPALAGKTVTGGRLDVSRAVDSFDVQAPSAPLLSVVPASPANDNAPEIVAGAEENSTVRLYAGVGCSGPPLAVVSAAAAATPGVTVSVADDSTTAFSATATDTADNVSGCSAPLSYVESSTPVAQVVMPPVVSPPALVGPPAPKCRVPALKGKSLAAAKRALTKAGCVAGKVKKPKGSKGKKLVVKKSQPGAGAERPSGARVGLTMKVKPPKKRR